VPARRLKIPAFPDSPEPGARIVLPLAEARKVRLVLRLRAGDVASVFDGSGEEWEIRLTRVVPEDVEGELVKRLSSAGRGTEGSLRDVALCVCLLKSGKTELVIQKAVELGVSRIVPVLSQRTVVRIVPGSPDADARAKRFRLVAEQAAAQCGRASVPAVDPPRRLPDVLREGPRRTRLVLVPSAKARLSGALSRLQPEDPVTLLTGPEGGLAPVEISGAEDAGWEPVTLGSSTLRGDTAPIVAAALALYASGDLG